MYNTVTYPVFTRSDIFMNLPLFYETRGEGGGKFIKSPDSYIFKKSCLLSYHLFLFFLPFHKQKRDNNILGIQTTYTIRNETKWTGGWAETRTNIPQL